MGPTCALAAGRRLPFGDNQERTVGVVAEPLRRPAEVPPPEPVLPCPPTTIRPASIVRAAERIAIPARPRIRMRALGELRNEGEILVRRHRTGLKDLDFDN